MQTPSLFNLSATALVDKITEELGRRCNIIAEVLKASQKIEHYTETVATYVRCINSDFFIFIEDLNLKLQEDGFGSAKLAIDDKQHELIGTLSPYDEWLIKHFSLLRARLNITLNYCVEGEPVRSEKISADVRFYPNEGYLDWSDGTVEVFRSHRGNAVGKAEFGADDLSELMSAYNPQPRGFDLKNDVTERYDPQFLVLWKICVNKDWPG